MKCSHAVNIAFIYLRLSNEDQRLGESGSITNQRKILEDYCSRNGIVIAREFVDDDWSGGNFNRPGFQSMIKALQADKRVNMILTKDLSRLGRDMSESSYYAERYFPEHGIRFIAVYDNYDSEKENLLAPFQFAINDVYLRDSSKKVKAALHTMMDRGEYCFRAPYGYKKDPNDNHKLILNEETAPVVKRIFAMADKGLSTWAIADALTLDGICPPLKYRVIHYEGMNSRNTNQMCDEWNNTTVKRILTNPVYLGHTMLGRTKKVSPKSDVARRVPQDDWHVTLNTHEALVTQEVFDHCAKHMGRRLESYVQYERVRKSVFSGIAYCSCCGSAMCSSGSVYNGEREKYWYLSCLNIPKRSKKQCPNGARIKYDVLVEIVRQELNELVHLSDEDKERIILEAVQSAGGPASIHAREKRIADIQQRLKVIDSLLMKVYEDMYGGRLQEDSAHRMLDKFQLEADSLSKELKNLQNYQENIDETRAAYRKFFSLTERFTNIDELTPELLTVFIERIIIEPKVYPPGVKVYARSKIPYEQKIHIYYRFIGERSKTATDQSA